MSLRLFNKELRRKYVTSLYIKVFIDLPKVSMYVCYLFFWRYIMRYALHENLP